MKTELMFPMALIVLNVGASVLYLIKGDIRMAVYFGAAAVLNITVVI